MLWTAFAAEAPELGQRGLELFAEEHGYSYLATLAADGSPRVHPVAPILTVRGLFVAVTRRSPKFADLVRDPRLALHAAVRPPLDEEFVVRGTAHEVEGEDARAPPLAAFGYQRRRQDGAVDATDRGPPPRRKVEPDAVARALPIPARHGGRRRGGGRLQPDHASTTADRCL